MLTFVNQLLHSLHKCFSRKTPYELFCIVVLGLILSQDKLGVTSIIRTLSLDGACYDSLIHFFSSSAFSISEVMLTWTSTVESFAPVYKVNGRAVLIGDHKKLPKEARRMPGVKSHKQSSENSGKAEFIMGHCFGCIGILIGSQTQYKCLPLAMRLHDGLNFIAKWYSRKAYTMVERVIRDAVRTARTLNHGTYLVLDAFFLSHSALNMRKELLEKNPELKFDLIVRAKKNYKANYPITQAELDARKGKRGRKPSKGADVKLEQVFRDHAEDFKKADVMMYGERKQVEYFALELLWCEKQPYDHLEFIFVKTDESELILATTDLTLDPKTAIHLYSLRFSIEESFKWLNSETSAFSYRFWSKELKKLRRYAKSNSLKALSEITQENKREKIITTVRRIHTYINCACIGLGILEILCFKFKSQIDPKSICYMRTYRGEGVLTVGQMKRFLTGNFATLLDGEPNSELTQLIKKRRSWLERLRTYCKAA